MQGMKKLVPVEAF